MANILQPTNPTGPNRQVLSYLTAGLVGLAGMTMMERAWQATPHAAPINLQQAVSDFDTGDLATATAAFHKLADAGDPLAAYWYGHALDLGLGTPVDTKAAVAQFEKAWAGGVTQAGTRLGELYLDGNAIPPDFAKARSYFTEAANRGDARAALDLGQMLKAGIGGAADPVAAFAWMEVAALHGNALAQTERDKLLVTLSPAQQEAASQMAARLSSADGGHAAVLAKQPAKG